MGDAATWAGVVVALVLGVLGLVDAKRSRRLAQQAGRQAEVANQVARDALRQAGRANEISEHANQLSEAANALVERSAAQQNEDWFVEWSVKWESRWSVLQLKNQGRDPAHETTVVLTADHLHRTYRIEQQVLAGDELTLPLEEIREPRIEYHEAMEAHARAFAAEGRVFTVPPYVLPARLVVRWRSGLGLPREQVLELQLS